MARAGPTKEKGKEKPKRLTSEEQHARFVEAAAHAGADESPDALARAFRDLDLKTKIKSNALRKKNSR